MLHTEFGASKTETNALKSFISVHQVVERTNDKIVHVCVVKRVAVAITKTSYDIFKINKNFTTFEMHGKLFHFFNQFRIKCFNGNAQLCSINSFNKRQMKKIVFISMVALTVLMLSCNKNKRAVKLLEGNWEEVSIDGVPVAEADKGVVHFEYCKLKKDEWCTMSYTDSDGTNSGDYDYLVKEKGEVMVQRYQDTTKGTVELTGKIIELDESKLILEMSLFTFVTTTEYKKK